MTRIVHFFPDHPDVLRSQSNPMQLNTPSASDTKIAPSDSSELCGDEANEHKLPTHVLIPHLGMKALISHVQSLWADKRFDEYVYDGDITHPFFEMRLSDSAFDVRNLCLYVCVCVWCVCMVCEWGGANIAHF